MRSPSVPPTSPRLYGIVAAKAPIVLIFRRGPSDWFHLLKWHLDKGTLEPGVWARKKLFARRCDVSDDGELLLYYLTGGVKGRYRVFCGISRTPWLHPLISWDQGDTWGRGWCFVPKDGTPHLHALREPFTKQGFTLQSNDIISFINERRRGWTEAPDCPPRETADTWDEMRSVVLHKPHTSNGCVLRLHGGPYQPKGGMDGKAPTYEIDWSSGQREFLTDVAWADWDHRGRLISATKTGHLLAEEIHGDARRVVEDHDLSTLAPNPQPAPDWAMSAPSAKGD